MARHVSRFLKPGDDAGHLAKFCMHASSSLRGSICLYQGEELGLPEADIAFEDLRDPYGIRFWPGFKGRDGCRTPMVWEELAIYAGFSNAKPWLPISEAHRKLAVSTQEYDPASVLAHYRKTLAFRKKHQTLLTGDIRFLDAPEGVLAFTREIGSERLLCVFNIGRRETVFEIPASLGKLDFVGVPGFPAPPAGEKGVVLQGLGVVFGKSA